jgi:hypothetical protein
MREPGFASLALLLSVGSSTTCGLAGETLAGAGDEVDATTEGVDATMGGLGAAALAEEVTLLLALLAVLARCDALLYVRGQADAPGQQATPLTSSHTGEAQEAMGQCGWATHCLTVID